MASSLSRRFASRTSQTRSAPAVSAWYLENSVRDAEWALNETRSAPERRHAARERDRPRRRRHDRHAAGHAQPDVEALVNIDAGNFSNRSRSRDNPLYSARLMRVPYLFIATAETRKSQDLFEEFQSMAFSERFEVTLGGSEIRHHDLSDYGRAVTAPMAHSRSRTGRRAAAVRGRPRDGGSVPARAFRSWTSRSHPVCRLVEGAGRPALCRDRPPPEPSQPRRSSGYWRPWTARHVTTLRDARRRDPEAPLFQPASLARIVAKALAARDLPDRHSGWPISPSTCIQASRSFST